MCTQICLELKTFMMNRHLAVLRNTLRRTFLSFFVTCESSALKHKSIKIEPKFEEYYLDAFSRKAIPERGFVYLDNLK